MNKIDIQLRALKNKSEMGLMTHAVIGYPTMKASEKIVGALVSGGSDFIELQIPFSDPVADGPVIMQACDMALKKGMTVKKAFAFIKKVSTSLSIPLLIMAYYNSIFRYGVKKFCNETKEASVAGLIVPDYPPEEETHEHLRKELDRRSVHLIRVVSPASTLSRLTLNAHQASGFVYCVSRFGITGKQKTLSPEIATYLSRVSKAFSLPKAVGFGISTPAHITSLRSYAEIAIVGSSIIELYRKSGIKTIEPFVRRLKLACGR